MAPANLRTIVLLTFFQLISSTLQATLYPSQVPTKKPSIPPSLRPTQGPSKKPSCKPSRLPSLKPTFAPSQPTAEPSYAPTISVQPTSAAPTYEPSSEPSIEPSFQPTSRPSQPTIVPTKRPTRSPMTTIPTYSKKPSVLPTFIPTMIPSITPSLTPTTTPSAIPSTLPTSSPTSRLTLCPSLAPTVTPSTKLPQPTTFNPSPAPSKISTLNPSSISINSPSAIPSISPSTMPSSGESITPSISPTNSPSSSPSRSPTNTPLSSPSNSPSTLPSSSLSNSPSIIPSNSPSTMPSAGVWITPSISPTNSPSSSPSHTPTNSPLSSLSNSPSTSPSSSLSISPSIILSNSLSTSPLARLSGIPSTTPSTSPYFCPSKDPTSNPSIQPTLVPSVTFSVQPSNMPFLSTIQPSNLISSTFTPSQPIPLSATFQVIQFIRNSSVPSASSITGQRVLANAILKSMPPVALGNVTDVLITDVHNYAPSTLSLQLVAVTRKLRINSFAASILGVIQMSCTVKIIAPIGGEISVVYNQLTAELTNAVLNGLFTKYLRDQALTESVSGLLNAYSDIPPVITSYQLTNPTLAPSVAVAPPQSSNAMSSAVIGGIAAGGFIAFTIVVFVLLAIIRRGAKFQVHMDPKPSQNSTAINHRNSQSLGDNVDAKIIFTDESKDQQDPIEYKIKAHSPNALSVSETPLAVDTNFDPPKIGPSLTAPNTHSNESTSSPPLTSPISTTVTECTTKAPVLSTDTATAGMLSNLKIDSPSVDTIAPTSVQTVPPQKKIITIAQLASKYVESTDDVDNFGELVLRDIDFDEEIRLHAHTMSPS